MERKPVIVLVGIGLISIVLFKNIYKLSQRVEEDRRELGTFENDLLTIQFPKNLVHEQDTTYLDTGELFNTVEGVAGSLSKDGFNRQYSISVGRYSKDFTTEDAFHLDSLKKNLRQRFANGEREFLNVRNIEICGVGGIKYVVRNGQDFEQSVMFSLDKNVVAISTKGKDSVDAVFDDVIRSVKIKQDRELHMRNY